MPYLRHAASLISIHAAREGGDVIRHPPLQRKKRFQSTPPVKAATFSGAVKVETLHISIHAAREGGDSRKQSMRACGKISIHAAREGGDSKIIKDC